MQCAARHRQIVTEPAAAEQEIGVFEAGQRLPGVWSLHQAIVGPPAAARQAGGQGTRLAVPLFGREEAIAMPTIRRSVLLAALAALLAVGCAAWGIARLQAYEPHWTRSARHAVAEAGFRASSTWAEFSDWIRLGH